MNPLNEYPGLRKALYLIQWVANGVLVVTGAVLVATNTPFDDVPQWYSIALASGPILWTYLGLTAQQNVSTGPLVVQGTIVDAAGATSEVTATMERAESPEDVPVSPPAADDVVDPPEHRSDTPPY